MLAGSDIGFMLNPVEQLKGEVEIRPMNIGGDNDADNEAIKRLGFGDLFQF